VTRGYDYRATRVATSGRYYHGTASNFDKFDLDKAGARDYGDFGVGVYLTPSGHLAGMYAYDAAKKTGGEPVVLQVRVRAHKTADFDDVELQKQVAQALGIPFPEKALNTGLGKQTRPASEAKAITQYMQSLGYDSGLARNGKELVVYDSHDISIEEVHPAADAKYL